MTNDPSNKEIVDLGKFSKGINNVAPDTDLPEGSLVSAINVDLDKEGNVIRRKGYTKVYSGSGIHSLHKTYFVEGSELKDLDGNVYDTGLSLTRYLAWENILGLNYYSDGNTLKTIEHGQVGVPLPAGQPILTETTGLLDAGIYQVVVCHRDSNTGEIGGGGLSNTITVGDSAGINLSNIFVHPDGYDTVVFVSTQNGEELYQNTIIQNGLTTVTIINSRKSTRIFDTQFMEPLPGGHILRHFKARLYVARDNVLWFSEPFRYGLRRTSKDFFQFPERVTIVQPVEDGIYVVADKTYFLTGTEPKDMQMLTMSLDKGIEGTGIGIGSKVFDVGVDVQAGYWFSDKGAILGLPKGELKLLTDKVYALNDSLNTGVTMYKEINGIRQVLTNFSNKGNVSGFEFKEQLSSVIIRNGVIVQ